MRVCAIYSLLSILLLFSNLESVILLVGKFAKIGIGIVDVSSIVTSLSYRFVILNERLGGMSRRLNVRARTNRYLIARRVRAHVHVHVRAARARNTCHVLATSGAHTRGIPIRTSEHTLDPRAG